MTETNSKIDDIEPRLRGAISQAIEQGYHLISGDWGVRRSATNLSWESDDSELQQPCCCAVGALLLMDQPEPPVGLSGADVLDAAVGILGVDRFWMRDFLNGFDSLPMQSDASEDAYQLGRRLSEEFFPLSYEVLVNTPAHSEVRMKTIPVAESLGDLDQAFEPIVHVA